MKEFKVNIKRFYLFLAGHKHSWRDIGVELMPSYICRSCDLQRTMMGYKMWWFRFAPWLKDFDPNFNLSPEETKTHTP